MGVRSLVAVLLCLLAWFNTPVFGAQLDSRELTVLDIPPCGVSYSVTVHPTFQTDLSTASMPLPQAPTYRLRTDRHGLHMCQQTSRV